MPPTAGRSGVIELRRHYSFEPEKSAGSTRYRVGQSAPPGKFYGRGESEALASYREAVSRLQRADSRPQQIIMNASPASSIVGRLSIGISRVSIRHGHATPRFRPARPELTGFEPGHGERIWIFNNIESNQVIYSHGPAMDVRKQISISANHVIDQVSPVQPCPKTNTVQRQEAEAS